MAGSIGEGRHRLERATARCLSGLTVDGLIKRVSETVVGQDEAVRRVSGFLLASLRRVLKVAGGTPASELPRAGALMLEGPSGCGKTMIVRAACAGLGGVRTYVIDGSSLTGAGWRGGNLEDHEYRIAMMQVRDAGPIVVFVDEADKLAKGGTHARDGFDPCQQFLTLLEGDDVLQVEAPPGSGGSEALGLDKAGLVFVFAGAFTGLDEVVRSRLAREAGGPSAGFSAEVGARSLGEAELRGLSRPEDLVVWGLPRELVGRITSLARVRPLSEEDLVSIVRGPGASVELRFAKMMPAGCTLSVSLEATALVARCEACSGRGARGVESALTPAYLDAVELAEMDPDVISVTVVERNGELTLEVERGKREVPDRDAADAGGAREDSGTPDDDVGVGEASDERGWEPPMREGDTADDLAHVSVRLRMAAGEGAPDPVLVALGRDGAREMATAITDVALVGMRPIEARLAWELLYGCLMYARVWGAPQDAGASSLKMLLDEAARGELLDRVLEVWDGRSRRRRGEISQLHCSGLLPGIKRRRGSLEYYGLDAGDDPGLRHILYFYAIAGRRARSIARRASAAVAPLAR